MKFVKLSQEELKEIATFYRGVMATAYEGLFFREGKVIGKGIMEVIPEDANFHEKAGKLIEARGWVDDIELKEDRAIAKGGVEVHDDSDSPTCHRTRGILSSVYEIGTDSMVDVTEVKCESLGDDHCEFEIEIKGF